MKRLLPIIGLIIAVTVAVWPYMNDIQQGFSLGYATLSQSENQRPGMVNARLTGIDAHQRPYAVTANEMFQLADDGETIALRSPQADITMTDGSWVAVSSDIGVYQRSTHILGLRNNVSLYHDSGFEFHTASAYIDIKNGQASGDESIVGHGPTGEITAQGFYLPGGGQRVIFTGKSHLVVDSRKDQKESMRVDKDQ